MNTGTKVTVGIGAVMILVGIIVMGLGVGAAAGVGDWRPTDDVFWEGESGTGSFVHVEEGVGSYVLVMVTDDIRCDEFTLEIEGGMASWEQDWCVEDGKLPSGHEDDFDWQGPWGLMAASEPSITLAISADDVGL